ncbi:hypothetical protein Aduo_018978 [Ancylostoma duodenale]
MDEEARLAVRKRSNMKRCPERWTGHREERVLDEKGRPQLCPFCGEKRNHTTDKCSMKRPIQMRLWLVQKREAVQEMSQEERKRRTDVEEGQMSKTTGGMQLL